MRFLQTEWHRHERDRNAWEIEREEMKKRIATLEGESRTARGIRMNLEKHVKILEMALRKEREKIRALNKGEEVDLSRDPRDVAREELKAAGKGAYFPQPLGSHLTTQQKFQSSKASVASRPTSMPTTISSRAFDRSGSAISLRAIWQNAVPRYHTMSFRDHSRYPRCQIRYQPTV
jgi:hypothetical protein